MFKTQQLIKIGVYDEKFLAREEEDLAKRFKEKFKISRLPIPLYQYRLHGKNMTKNKKLMKKYKKRLKEVWYLICIKFFPTIKILLKKFPYIIAEVGVNHECSMHKAKKDDIIGIRRS